VGTALTRLMRAQAAARCALRMRRVARAARVMAEAREAGCSGGGGAVQCAAWRVAVEDTKTKIDKPARGGGSHKEPKAAKKEARRKAGSERECSRRPAQACCSLPGEPIIRTDCLLSTYQHPRPNVPPRGKNAACVWGACGRCRKCAWCARARQ